MNLPGAHLGRRVSALVDDQMPPDERDRALAHLAGCTSCRAAVESERSAKTALRGLAAPEPSAGLLSGLLEMGGPDGPLPRERPRFPGDPGAPAPLRTAGFASGGFGTGGSPRLGSGPLRLGVAAVGVVGAGFGLAYVAGGAAPTPAIPAVVPAVDQMTAEHVRRSGGTPFSDPAAVTRTVRGLLPASPSPR